ncbi:MAG TPA: 50S ribosomal protein L17 [Thermoanaerobaculia bacterium]|nr:50S ribosomal protein L17 [Thermoanaerobaculia bacterium]
MVNRKLGRTASHRAAMFRNQLASLIENERIVTTLPKAKELRPLIEKLVTLGKNDSVHARRQAERMVADDHLVSKLFGTLGPRFAERPGGYTRIIKLGARRGDAAEMAILEFVGYQLPEQEKPAAGAGAAAAAPKKEKKAKAEEPAAPAEEAAPAEAKPKKKAAPKKEAAPKKKAAAKEDKPKKKPSSSKKKSK